MSKIILNIDGWKDSKKTFFFTIQDDKNYQRSFATKMFASVFCLGANFLIFLNWKKEDFDTYFFKMILIRQNWGGGGNQILTT
jgi:hypothetical protein